MKEYYRRKPVFVVYCTGPPCNGANKAAMRLSQLGRPGDEEMIGGAHWLGRRKVSLWSKDDRPSSARFGPSRSA